MDAIDGWNQALIQLRKRVRLTQAGAARQAGLSASQLSRYESGSASPSLRTLGRILEVYRADLPTLGEEIKAARKFIVPEKTKSGKVYEELHEQGKRIEEIEPIALEGVIR